MNQCCTKCKRQFPLSRFRPANVEREARKRKLFDDAFEAFLKEENESTVSKQVRIQL